MRRRQDPKCFAAIISIASRDAAKTLGVLRTMRPPYDMESATRICVTMPRMATNTRARKTFGASAERVAALHLEQHGYRILARNVRTRYGEIDLIAEDADGIAFVEVKARRGRAYGAPEEALTPRKQLKLVQLADAFIAAHEMFSDKAWRIDVVALELDQNGKLVRLELVKNAVQM